MPVDRAGAGFGQQHAAVGERVGDRERHLALGLTRLEIGDDTRERTVRREDVIHVHVTSVQQRKLPTSNSPISNSQLPTPKIPKSQKSVR